LQSVSAAWKKAQLQKYVPVSFVEISYHVTDPEAEADASAASNGQTAYSDTAQTVTALDKNYEKYATFEANMWALDGSFPLLPEPVTQDIGFVSSSLSGADFSFSPVPVITISFSTVHQNPIPGVTIQWSEAFNECAADFTVTAFNGSSVVASAAVSGNTENVTFTETEISGYDKIEIAIRRWCLPFHRARVEQITIGALKIFGGGELLGYSHNMFASPISAELPKTEVIFEIDNRDGLWNPDNPQGVYKYLMERQEITVRYGFKINGAVEWIAAGTFYMADWETPQNGISASFTARDILDFMTDPFNVSAGTYTLFELASMAFSQSNIPATPEGGARWEIDEALKNISVTVPVHTDGSVNFPYTCGETAQLCANAAMCVMHYDREGIMRIEPLSEILTDYLIDELTSYQNAEYKLTKQLKSVDVNDGQAVAQNSAAGEVQAIRNPLIGSAAHAANVAEWVKGILAKRKTLSGRYRADPRIDIFDRVRVKNKYAENAVVVDSLTFTYNGLFDGSYDGRAGI